MYLYFIVGECLKTRSIMQTYGILAQYKIKILNLFFIWIHSFCNSTNSVSLDSPPHFPCIWRFISGMMWLGLSPSWWFQWLMVPRRTISHHVWNGSIRFCWFIPHAFELRCSITRGMADKVTALAFVAGRRKVHHILLILTHHVVAVQRYNRELILTTRERGSVSPI